MKVIPLGAGQDVGRSCIIVTINNKTIMLDCGVHMGYSDSRRYPDFSYLSKTNNMDKIIDCVIISHFHLDHSGALPYFTEYCNYNGPIYMTHATKAVLLILLDDFRKISEKFKEKRFTKKDIENCIKKAKIIDFLEEYEHEENFIIKPYYAGHVIGAAMFYVKVGDESFVYTGDFNTTPDKHLGGAVIDRLEPTLLITESTYGSIVRDCRKIKEREFLNMIFNCVTNGGKVLIPIFSLGRAQELCILLDTYWERMNLKRIPIYTSSNLTDRANSIYKLFIQNTNESIRDNILKFNPFNYNNIKAFKKEYMFNEGPMVLFASPGMLHSGTSLTVFKHWCGDEKNLIILPGYCVKNTVGERILNGQKTVKIEDKVYEVKIQVKNLAFSAHADSNGILQLINKCKPENVALVHGEKQRMSVLKKKIEKELKIRTFCPNNGTLLSIPKSSSIPLQVGDKNAYKISIQGVSNEEVKLKMKISTEFINDRRKINVDSVVNLEDDIIFE